MIIRKQLIALAIIHEGNWKKIFNDLITKNLPDEELAEKLYATIKSNVVTILDAAYPQYLKEYYQPPFVLFYYGDLSLISDYNHNVAVVGSREPEQIHVEKGNAIVQDLAKRYIIVSGLAKGIDREAHLSTINSGGKTVAILGSGIDVCYPSINKDIYEEIKRDHLLISEYYGEIMPDQDHFPHRNRLIAMMSKILFIPDGHYKSGTSITAKYAEMFGHTIYCLPSSDVDNSLCNSLIKDGSILVRSSEDIFYDLESTKSYYPQLNNNII